MLVDNFTHDRLLVVQHVRIEVEKHVEHGRLRGIGCCLMLEFRVRFLLIVDIVGSQSTDDHADHILTKADASIVGDGSRLQW